MLHTPVDIGHSTLLHVTQYYCYMNKSKPARSWVTFPSSGEQNCRLTKAVFNNYNCQLYITIMFTDIHCLKNDVTFLHYV